MSSPNLKISSKGHVTSYFNQSECWKFPNIKHVEFLWDFTQNCSHLKRKVVSSSSIKRTLFLSINSASILVKLNMPFFIHYFHADIFSERTWLNNYTVSPAWVLLVQKQSTHIINFIMVFGLVLRFINKNIVQLILWRDVVIADRLHTSHDTELASQMLYYIREQTVLYNQAH